MKGGSRFRPVSIMPLVILMLLGGCATTRPSRFYILHSLAGLEAKQGAAPAEQAIALGIGPIKLPEYLDRPQIVTRSARNELQLAEFDRWAEPLEEGFTRVFAENLGSLLATDRVAVFPWAESMRVDFQVTVDVTRFDGDMDGKVVLEARWTILQGDDRQVLMMKQSSFSQSADSPGYDALVGAQSRALADLCRELATSLKSLLQTKPRP